MLKTKVQDRQSGKTTKVINLMNEDAEAILVIPTINMKQFYPRKLNDRIVSGEELLNGKLRGRNFSKLILDEGFLYHKEKLAHLYYYLGYHHHHVVSFGTV